jgi:hypothetical protein
MRVATQQVLTTAALALLIQASALAREPVEFGPLLSKFSLTLQPGERTEALGPLLSLQESESERIWAFSPLFSYRNDPLSEVVEFDLIYPLLTHDRIGLEYRWQFFQLFSFSGGQTIDDARTRRFTLFPFYFQQRSDDPELNYTAVVPFYGHLKNRLFRDEITFIMLPLYLQSRRRDVVTDNYLLPIVHLRRGEGLRGWQVWPVVGHEHRKPMVRTNQYDELETIAGHDKLFVLWPIFFSNQLGLGTTNLQTQRILLPLYSIQRAPMRDSTTILWPFGLTYTEDRERGFREWSFPWPFVTFARGEGKTINRVWPLFSQASTPTLQSHVYLWPFYRYNRLEAEPLERERTRILFFLYSDLIERNTVTGSSRQRTDLWPLFTARRDHNGNERLQIFAPLEPLLPNHRGVERNYSPVWSVWRSEKNGESGAASHSLLWNLYRRETSARTRKSSLLFGLFHYQSDPGGRQWRLFYIPIGKRQAVEAGFGSDAAHQLCSRTSVK